MATTWQWSFHLIPITTPDWTGLWIPSLNLSLFHQISLIAERTKNNIMWEVVARRCSAKNFSEKFHKIHWKYLCYSLFLILLKAFRPSDMQFYCRETPALVFQNQPFLRNRCSWIIHKIHRKTPMLGSLFKKIYQ